MTTLHNFGEEFTIKFEMLINAPPTGTASVLHFAVNNESTEASRMPAIFLAPTPLQLLIKFGFGFNHFKNVFTDTKYWIEISKTPHGIKVKITRKNIHEII